MTSQPLSRLAASTAAASEPSEAGRYYERMLRLRLTPTMVEVRGLGVRYDLELNRARTLRSSLARLVARRRSRAEVWAVRDATFELHQGQCIAIIGPNGAGKSTLLQALAGIIPPTQGEVLVRGRVSSLLNLGVGFDPNLTGRENVGLAAAFFGLGPAETRLRLPEIIDFSELGDFIDAPIRTYSSGMRARLGFSIASVIEPELLLVDEVLGTGDAGFREKSKRRIGQLLLQARAVVLVTHDMTWVSEFADYALVMRKGRVVAEGRPAAAVEFHRAHLANPARQYRCECADRAPDGEVCLTCGLLRHAAPAW